MIVLQTDIAMWSSVDLNFCLIRTGVVIHAQNSCHLRELDLCVASGLASGQNLPTTVAEINKQCQGLKEMNDCIGNYSRRCSTKSMREFLRSITTQGDVQSWHQNFCDKENSEERQQYLKHATCLNQAQKEARTCMRDLTVALDRAINNDVEKRIPGKRLLTIASFQSFIHCAMFAWQKCAVPYVVCANVMMILWKTNAEKRAKNTWTKWCNPLPEHDCQKLHVAISTRPARNAHRFYQHRERKPAILVPIQCFHDCWTLIQPCKLVSGWYPLHLAYQQID